MATKQQPSSTAQHIGGVVSPTARNVRFQKRFSLALGLISILVSIILLINGYALPFTIALSAYTLYIGIRRNAPYLSIVGIAGVLLTIVGLIVISLN